MKKTFQLEIFLWHFWDTLCILLDLLATFRAYLGSRRISPEFSTLTLLFVNFWMTLPPWEIFVTFLEYHSNFTGFILLFVSLLIWSQVIYLHLHSLPTWLLEIFLWHFWDTSRILLDLFTYFRAYLQGSRTSPDFSTPSLLWADLAHHLPTTANSPSHGAAGIFCLVAWGGVLANPIQNRVPRKINATRKGPWRCRECH